MRDPTGAPPPQRRRPSQPAAHHMHAQSPRAQAEAPRSLRALWQKHEALKSTDAAWGSLRTPLVIRSHANTVRRYCANP